ncbi:MAG: metallophosphoesterase [Clostridia bacterium]|nr:metallophosphoesterase [Clostridia bacterium]
MKYYVVSDVHGYYTCLTKALRDAGFFDETEECKLVVCGDLFDRGPEAKSLIKFILQLMKDGRLIYILGNHEDLLVQCLQEISRGNADEIASGMSCHYSNMTWDTLLQISEMSESEACKNPNELVRRVMQSSFYRELLPACVDYFETPKHIFTHGWIPVFTLDDSYTYNPDWRNADVQEWRRARWLNGMELACKHRVVEPDKTIVCGHWHTSYGHACFEHSCSEMGEDADFSPFGARGILAIDASTHRSQKVNCVVVED